MTPRQHRRAARRHVGWWWATLLLLPLWILASSAHAAPAVDGPPPLQIEVGDEADPVKLRLGASVWARAEVRQEQLDPSWTIPQRTRLEAEARWRGLAAFVQLQDVRAWGTAPSTTSTPATTGLHQGYLELGGRRGAASGFLRLGRQEHVLGALRLIGNAPWNPNMRSLDGLRLHGAHGPFSLDLAAMLLRAPSTFTVTDDAGVEHTLESTAEGLLTAAAAVEIHRAATLELYTLVRNESVRPDDLDRDRFVVSPGARLSGQPWRGLDYDAEGYVQTGRWDGHGHGAWMGAATVGYRWSSRMRPRLEGGYWGASGSRCEQVVDEVVCDRRLHADLEPFFGARHRFLGMLDLFAPVNVQDAWGGVRIEPAAWTELRAEVHHFMLTDPTGRWLRTDLSAVATPDPSNRRHTVGEEVDLTWQLHPWGPLTVQLGYGVLVPTGAGPGLIGDRPWQFGYLLTQLAF